MIEMTIKFPPPRSAPRPGIIILPTSPSKTYKAKTTLVDASLSFILIVYQL